MKFLILLPYFNRPNLVKFAINSVLSETYENWELVICDDGSDVTAEEVLLSMGIQDERIKIKRLNDSIYDKETVGSRSGKMMNEATCESDADYVIILCDDDGIFPGYLEGLNKFYEKNPIIKYSYGHVSIYNPQFFIDTEQLPEKDLSVHMNYTHDLNGNCMLDASQVSWKLNKYTESIFPFPQTAALDAVVFQKLFELFGPCKFNGLVAQYKGWFVDQMGNRLDQGLGIEPMIQ